MTDLTAGLNPRVEKAVTESGLLKDPEIASSLRAMTPESRKQVLQRIGSLGMVWEDAVEGAEYEDADAVDAREFRGSVEPNPNRLVMSFRRDSLKPNKYNAALFPDSLSGESIEVLAESLKTGQRVPIEITNSHIIVNGERRWRAAEIAGLEMVDVTYVGDLSEEEILDRVLDSYTSTRQPSPREKALVYKAVYERLQETLGRKHGERFSNENVSSPKELKKLAIKRAGISSIMMAERLIAIFERAPEHIQERVNSGEMSVAAGYEEIPKRPREKPSEEPQPEDEPDITDVTEDGVWVNPFATRGRLPDGTIVSHDGTTAETEASGEKGPATSDEARASDEAHACEESDDTEAEEGSPEKSNLKPGEQETLDLEENRANGSEPDTSLSHNTEKILQSISVDEALEALALHLERLVADDGFKPARAELESWVRWLFERAKAARSQAA